jgi:tRNA(adenine34) deaminase
MREFTNDEEAYMELALAEARLAFEEGEVPIGAVLVLNGKVISRAHNQVEILNDATAHAEMICIKEAAKKIGDFRLVDFELYTTIEPCLMCFGASILSRVKKIVYGSSDKRHGAVGGLIDLKNLEHPIHNIEIRGGLKEVEARELIQNFFKMRRKENKVNA